MRVLVADDDPTYRALLEDLLTKWQFEVVLAKDGLEALSILRGEDPPPLVLLDWEMPGADGYEVVRAIRQEKAIENTYVLMVTGSYRKSEMMRVLVCGADNYLIKPFDQLDLKINLRTAVRLLQLQQELDELRSNQQQPAPAP